MMLLASGCARSRNAVSAGQNAQSDTATQPADTATQPADTAASADRQPADATAPGPQPAPDLQVAGIGSSDFLAHRRPRRLLPEDAMIGPLADDRTGSADDRIALQAADRLLKAVLRGGDLTGAPLSAKGRAYVAESIGYHLRRGVTLSSFRLGRVQRTRGAASLRARLSGPFGSTPADLFLILDAGRWLVDDVQADWTALERPQPEPEAIPLPRTDGWTWF